MDRLIYNALLQWKLSTRRKPLLLKGARQVGKTTVLKYFGGSEYSTCHYFNFEKEPGLAQNFEQDLDPTRIVQALSLHRQIKIDLQTDLIIFDEIQACPNALTSLKYFCEDLPEAHLCCAGSLLGIYLGPVSYPVGKVDHLQMYPMTFVEFLKARGDDMLAEFFNNLTLQSQVPTTVHEQLWERLKHYFIVGGLPEVVDLYRQHVDELFTAFTLARDKQQDLIQDYYADIAKHSGKVNAQHIVRIWQSVVEQLGAPQDSSARKFRFKNVVPGIDRFDRMADALDWLDSAGLTLKVNIASKAALPLKSYVKENTFKLFMFDVGILGALSELPPSVIVDYEYGTYKGYFAENFVAQAFSAAYNDRLYSWTEATSEVEFIRQINGDIIPIEVKSGWVTQAKSIKIFAQKYSPPYRVIMSAKQFNINNDTKLHSYPLYMAEKFPLPEF